MGWCSKKFCSYPQELILQFAVPIRLRQLQILSHQYKISSRVEIFYYLPARQVGQLHHYTPFDPNAQFVRVGYLGFDDNERTGFTAREMKTVHVDVYCQYVKLALYQPYENKLNIF